MPPTRTLKKKIAELSKSSTKQPPTDLQIYFFPTTQSFTFFLRTHHATLPGIYLKLARASSGIQSLTWSQAVEVALCFGWIDGVAKPLDHVYHLRRFTPRRARSVWSARNVATVGRLVEEGKMQEAGLRAVEVAKTEGRWEVAYHGIGSDEVPEDMNKALDEAMGVREIWERLGKKERYALILKIQTGAPKTREKRIVNMVQSLVERNNLEVTRSGSKAKAKAKATSKTGNNRKSALVRADE